MLDIGRALSSFSEAIQPIGAAYTSNCHCDIRSMIIFSATWRLPCYVALCGLRGCKNRACSISSKRPTLPGRFPILCRFQNVWKISNERHSIAYRKKKALNSLSFSAGALPKGPTRELSMLPCGRKAPHSSNNWCLRRLSLFVSVHVPLAPNPDDATASNLQIAGPLLCSHATRNCMPTFKKTCVLVSLKNPNKKCCTCNKTLRDKRGTLWQRWAIRDPT